MDDDEVTMGLKELENLPDDLFLEDVGKSIWASRSKRRPSYGGRGTRRGYPRKGGRGGRKVRDDEDRGAWSDEHPGDLSFEEEADAEWRRDEGQYRKDKDRGEFRRVMMKEDLEDAFEGNPRNTFDMDRRRRSRERPWEYGQKSGADTEEGDEYFNSRFVLSRKRRTGRISSANDDSCSPSVLDRQHRHGSKELGLESPVKKRERSLSTGRYSARGHWERSTSPQSVCHSDRGQSVSPPSGSRHQTVGRSSRSRRAGNHEWSVSPPPQRHVRKQPTSRYLATRSPEAEQWSGGAPLGHRTSTQPQGHYPVSIPGAQPQGSYVIPPPMSANMYPEGGYIAPSSNYGGQATSSYHGDYQQYSYDSYYQQPQPSAYTSEYVALPAQTGWQQQDGYGRDVGQQHVAQGAGGLADNSVVAAAAHQKADNAKKEAAIQNELIQQKQTLALQREEYMKKSASITRELSLLKDQEKELLHDDSRDSKRILHENHKLQLEIQNKLKAINNVIDMLTGIIGDSKMLEKSKSGDKVKKADAADELFFGDDMRTSPLTAGSGDGQHQYNLVYYDPEMHWCRVCDIFPRTAKEYLNHLHSDEHKHIILEKKLTDLPWHKSKADDVAPFVDGLPSKRTPIRGLQFFVSATAWYCKLCDTWIGDLHCASVHLKSKAHSEKYTEFTHQNPHWETDWLADREKAYEEKRLTSSGAGRKNSKKCKDRSDKKRRSSLSKDSRSSSGSSSSTSSTSSSSSSSEEGEGDRARSIHVAMRNKVKQQQQVAPPPGVPAPPEGEVPRSKWDSPPQAKEEPHEEKLVKEWVSVDKERQLQDRAKQKRGGEDRERIREQEREREREREERDREREREEREKERERERAYERGGRKERSGRKHSDSPKSRRDRDRERERDRGRERRRGSPGASPRRGRGAADADSEAETKFEKRFSESAKMKKAKKQQPASGAVATSTGTAPKSKLPFIGRMPLLKNIARKKGEAAAAAAARPEDVPRGPEDMDIDDDVSGGEAIAENVAVGPPPEAGDAPEPPLRQQLPPPPPPFRADATRPPEGAGLPKDFQEALDILFPGEERPREQAPVAWGHPYVGAWAPPPAVMFAPPAVVNGPPPSSRTAPVSEEDLAMLGIDAGDMAAQTF